MSKTIFITGGSTGIGAASVRKFIKEGWNVCFMDINVEEAEKLQADINVPERLLFVEGNTRVRSDIRKAVATAIYDKLGFRHYPFRKMKICSAQT